MDLERERRAWLVLAEAALPARLTPARLVAWCGSARAVIEGAASRLPRRLGPATGRALRHALRRAHPERILRRAGEAGQRVLTPADSDWPRAALQGTVDPPAVLFVRGRLPAPEDRAVAVVGTRDATPYGLRAARALSTELAQAGLWVLSGFAVGIDGAAHESTLEVGGRTLAVLGCGLDHGYPMAHAELKEAVALEGGLLSEHGPGTPPQKWHFPRRNRLVAALAQAVVVVEAAGRSGALITARLALDQGREVLAVPGSIFARRHEGCHRLLRQGAALCTGAPDVLAALGLGRGTPSQRRAAPTSEPEGLLWSLLDDHEALDAASLCLRTGLDASAVASALTALELEGRVARLPGVGFLRRS